MFAFVKTPTLLMETKIMYRCSRCPTSMNGEGHTFQFPVENHLDFERPDWREMLWKELKATPRLCERCISREAAEKKRTENVEWVTPVIMNDWGTDYFYAVYDSAECLSDIGTFCAQSCPFPYLKSGDSVEVKWPDDTVSVAVLRKGEGRGVTINDMGHDYHTSTSDLYVEQYVKGTVSLVPLVGSGIMLRPAAKKS